MTTNNVLAGMAVKLSGDADNFNAEFIKASRTLTKFGKQVQSDVSSINKSLDAIGGAVAGAFSVAAIASFGSKLIDVTSETQKFAAVLTNSLGSNSEAQRSLQFIQDFAASTPYSVSELTDSFVKFANRGVKLTSDQMRSLGDLASSTGKSFDQLTEAALDAFTGEFERLKEFGVLAKKQGDQVQFTFKGVTTVVENSDQAIKNYLLSLGNAEGVTGSMAAVSKTLGGQISNLGDTFDNLFRVLGEGTGGVLSGAVGMISDYVAALTNGLKSTEQLNKEVIGTDTTHFIEAYQKAGKAVRSELDQTLAAEISNIQKRLATYEKIYADQVKLGHGSRAQEAKEIVEQERFLLQSRQSRLESLKTFYADESKAAVAAAEKAAKAEEARLKPFQDILKALSDATKMSVAFGDSFNLTAEKVQILESGIGSLIKAGFAPMGREIQTLKAQLDSINRSSQALKDTISNINSIESIGVQTDSAINLPVTIDTEAAIASMKKMQEELRPALAGIRENVTTELAAVGKVVIDMSGIMGSALTEFATFAGETLGALFTGDFNAESFFAGLMGIVANFLASFGKALVSAGVAALAFQQLLANPYAAIAAGVAVIALSAVVKSLLKKGPSGNVPALATGTNYVPNDMLAYIHKGEAVVPKKYNPNAFGVEGGTELFGEFRVKGSDLVMVLEKENYRQGRRG